MSSCGVSNSDIRKYYLSVGKVEQNGNKNVAYIIEKDGDNKIVRNAVQGDLIDLYLSEQTWQDQQIFKVNFVFVSPEDRTGDRTIVSCGRFRAFSRHILNRLASLKTFENVRISPYVFEYTDNAGKKQTMVCGSVKQNDERADMRYAKEEIPETRKYTVPNTTKTVLITQERDEFYNNLAKELGTRIQEYWKGKIDVPSLRYEAEIGIDVDDSSHLDEVPF